MVLQSQSGEMHLRAAEPIYHESSPLERLSTLMALWIKCLSDAILMRHSICARSPYAITLKRPSVTYSTPSSLRDTPPIKAGEDLKSAISPPLRLAIGEVPVGRRGVSRGSTRKMVCKDRVESKGSSQKNIFPRRISDMAD